MPTYSCNDTDYKIISKARKYWEKHYRAKGLTSEIHIHALVSKKISQRKYGVI